MRHVQRGSLRSNAALSLVASATAAAAAIIAIPVIINGVGLDQYGLFALLGVATAYIGVLDFGFSWTTSRFVAEALAREDDRALDDVLGASLLLYATLGVLGGGVLAVAAPLLIDHVFNVPQTLRSDGVIATRVLAVAFPAAMFQTYAAAVLRGAQRFGLMSTLQGGSAIVTSAALVWAATDTGGIVGLAYAVAGVQIIAALAGLASARYVLPTSIQLRIPSTASLSELTRFSGKVAVTNLGVQLLYLPNRLAVGALLSLNAVAQFTVPLSLAQRLQVIPSALASAALPTLTADAARPEEGRFRQVFWELVATSFVLLGPIGLLGIVWAPEVLTVWFSTALNEEAATVLRLSIAAVALNAGTSVLSVACDSCGFPGIPARGAIAAGIVNVVLAFWLTSLLGVVGAALALLLSLALMGAVIVTLWRTRGMPRVVPVPRPSTARHVRGVLALTGLWFTLAAALQGQIDDRLSLGLATVGMLGVAYAGLGLLIGFPRMRGSTVVPDDPQ